MLVWLVEIYAGFGMETRKWEVQGSYANDVIDNLIDYLMKDEDNNRLFDFKCEYEDDMIVIGGNCSDRLITYGMIKITPFKEIDEDSDAIVKEV